MSADTNRTPTHRLLTANLGLMATCPALTLPLFTALILIGETPGITAQEITKRIYDRSVSRGLFRFVKREGGRFVRVEGEFTEKTFRLCRLSLTEEGQRVMEEYLGDVLGEAPAEQPSVMPLEVPIDEDPEEVRQRQEKADREFQEWLNVLKSDEVFQRQCEEGIREEGRRQHERIAFRRARKAEVTRREAKDAGVRGVLSAARDRQRSP